MTNFGHVVQYPLKIKGAEKSMQKLTNLLFELLAIILEKRRCLYFPVL